MNPVPVLRDISTQHQSSQQRTPLSYHLSFLSRASIISRYSCGFSAKYSIISMNVLKVVSLALISRLRSTEVMYLRAVRSSATTFISQNKSETSVFSVEGSLSTTTSASSTLGIHLVVRHLGVVHLDSSKHWTQFASAIPAVKVEGL